MRRPVTSGEGTRRVPRQAPGAKSLSTAICRPTVGTDRHHCPHTEGRGFPVEDICCIIRSRAKREQFYLTGRGRMENILMGIPFHFISFYLSGYYLRMRFARLFFCAFLSGLNPGGHFRYIVLLMELCGGSYFPLTGWLMQKTE